MESRTLFRIAEKMQQKTAMQVVAPPWLKAHDRVATTMTPNRHHFYGHPTRFPLESAGSPSPC